MPSRTGPSNVAARLGGLAKGVPRSFPLNMAHPRFVQNVAKRSAPAGGPQNFLEILVGRGFTVDCCLDIAAADCYDGSAQDVFDLTTNNVDFWRGADNTATTNDPTFVGTAGDLLSTTYFSFDGGDFLRAKSQPAFIQQWHKALCTKTALFLVQLPDNTIQGAFGTQARNIANIGVIFDLQNSVMGTRKIGCTVSDGGNAEINPLSTAEWTAGQIVLLGIAIDEDAAGTASAMFIDGTTETFNGAYPSPSASSATYTLEVGAAGNAAASLDSTARLHACAFIASTLVKTDFDNIRADLVAQGRIT